MPDPHPRGDILMSWTFPEFDQHQRSRAWYLWFMAAVIAFLGYAIWAANYTFAFIIFLAAFILVVRLRRRPLPVTVAIREEGIEVGQRFWTWRELKEYWIIYRPPETRKLYLEFKGAFRPALDISLETQNPLKIRQVLNEFLLENTKREEEPVSDQWSRALKI
ncbi:MAG: hypothetical protein HYY50_01465 [Candidatus Kerfeldbacteria bacterium]|nr:hypothetical protein [Candidatus Kerfeldbacteria bacterium]